MRPSEKKRGKREGEAMIYWFYGASKKNSAVGILIAPTRKKRGGRKKGGQRGR